MIYFILIAVVVAGEYGIKRWMEAHLSEDKSIFRNTVCLNLYHNKGIALNLLKNNVKLIKGMTGTTIGILLLILSYSVGAKGGKLRNLGLSLLIGGAISNLLDRMKQGYVTDYFSFVKCKHIRHIVFNLADIAIFIGGMMVVIAEVFIGKSK